MSDSIHLVTLDEQDQYVRLLELNDPTTIYPTRDTFRPVIAGRQASIAQGETRRSGASQVAERRDTGSVGATFMVKGTTSDLALARAESLLRQADAASRPRWLWWQPDGATRVALYPLIGPASQVQVNYTLPQFVSGFFPIEIAWPCQPWAEGLVQDVADDFRARDTGLTALQQFQRDYTTTVTPTSVAQSALELPAALASAITSKIARQDRQAFQDGWVTVKAKAKAASTNTSIVNTPGLRYTPSDGRLFFAQTSTTALTVQEWDGAAFQTRATVAITAPTVGTSFWLRIRAEGTSVTAEYWATTPTPTDAPAASTTYTNAASVRTGYPVLMARGPGSGSGNTTIIEAAEVRPYSWRLLNTPTTIATESLPGSMSAACDMDVMTQTADADYPRTLMLAWRRALAGRAATGAKSMLIQAETNVASGGSITPDLLTDATRYRGASNQGLRFTLTNATAAAHAVYRIDPTIFEPDDFSEECVVAVFVRYYRSSTAIVDPRLRAWMGSGQTLAAGATFAFPSYTPEFGTLGHALPKIGTGLRSTFLGTLALPIRYAEIVNLGLQVSWTAGTTAGTTIVLDEIYVVPITSMATSATAQARDSGTYAALMPANAYQRRVRWNRSGEMVLAAGVDPLSPSAEKLSRQWPLNMGGADLLLPAGTDGLGAELLVRPTAAVTDDPTDLASDIQAHNMSVHLRVTPRYHLFAA